MGSSGGSVTSSAIADDSIVNADVNSAAAIAESKIANLTTDLAALQPLDSDLTAIAALSTTATGRSLLTIANSAAGRSILAIGAPASLPNEPTAFLGATVPRCTPMSTAFALASGTVYMGLVYLEAGVPVSNIVARTGGTGLTRGSNADSHLWSFIADSSRVMVAVTADDTSVAWGASTDRSAAIANIASGASATYTPPTSGLYYAGIMCYIGTGGSPVAPQIFGAGMVNTSKVPIMEGTSDTGQTTVPSFPHTFGALTATGNTKLIWIT